MLLRFTVENHRSFRDEAILSFVSTRAKDAPTHRLQAPGAPHGVLPVVAVYGANASGKSNLVDALEFMRDEVSSSFTDRKPDGRIPFRPFALEPSARARPTTRTVDFVVDEVRYHYGYRHDATRFVEEWLFAFPQERQQSWFHRIDGEEIYFGPALKGQKRTIEAQTRPNSLFLSAAAQHNHEQLGRIYEWFSGSFNRMEGVMAPGRGVFHAGAPLLAPQHAGRVRDLLRLADLGVVDFRAEKDEPLLKWLTREGAAVPPEALQILAEDPPLRVDLAHASESGEPVFLRPDEESHGTQRLLVHLDIALRVLAVGAVLIVDELDAGLHPRLSAALLELFTSETSNPKGAQLLFTTHDTTLMKHLRRDEVVFTEKDGAGVSRVVPLSDYQTRKRDDIERGYNEGRYGGVPMVGDLADAMAGVSDGEE